MAWALLAVAALLEIAWALALKQADGLTRPWPTALGLVAAAASLGLLAVALRSLPIGTAYAAWTGLGTLGVALAGIVALDEPSSAIRVACLLLIVVGVAGLRVAEA